MPVAAQSKADARRRLEETERQLRERREAEQGLAADVGRIEADRRKLNQGLVEMAQQIQASEGRLTGIEGRLGALEAQEKFLRGSLAERHGSIARLLGVMQRMGRNPPPVMITRREDALVMVRSAMMLAAAFPQMRQQAMQLAGELDELGRVIGQTKTEGERLRTETERLNEQRTRLAGLLEEKRQSLAERQEALDRVRREAAEIVKSVTDLNELIARLDRIVSEQAGPDVKAPPAAAPAPAPAPPTTGPAPSAEALAQAPKAPPAAPQKQAALAPPPPAAVVLAPAGRHTASLNPARIKPAVPFAQTKGRLPLPANGKRILSFGDKAQASRSNGVVIETRPGAQVTSPADGWIVFAGIFRSYGQILIINAGDGYHILMAGLSQVDVQLGQFVLAGEPVGVMSGGAQRDAKGKASAGAQTASAPVLYVEFRKDNRAIDPEPWWAPNG
jgi:septal ring factor EnvC (AmiA/AmiB activator)